MVVAVVTVVCSFAIPNFLPPDVFERLPALAQRHIVPGLDLQVGSHLLLEVDRQAVVKERALDDSVRSALHRARVNYTGLTAKGDSVDVYINHGRRAASARQVADDLETAVVRIVELVKTRIPRRFGLDPIGDVQVLSPINRCGVGARSINIELRAALNPAGKHKVEKVLSLGASARASCQHA